MSADRLDRTRAVTIGLAKRDRQIGSQFARDSEICGRWASEKVEMSADRVNRTRAVTTRLTKRDPTKGKSVRERLRKIWQVGSKRIEMSADRLGRTRAVTIGLAKCDPTNQKSVHERLRKISLVRLDQTRAVTTRLANYDPTNRQKNKKSSRAVWGRVEMSANRLDRTPVDTTRLTKCRPSHRKSSRARKIKQERILFLPNISRLSWSLKAKGPFDYSTTIHVYDQLKRSARNNSENISKFTLFSSSVLTFLHDKRYKDPVKLNQCWILHNRPFKPVL